MSWPSHNTSYQWDTDLRISITRHGMDWPYVRHNIKLIVSLSDVCFLWWLNDTLTPTASCLWAVGGDGADGGGAPSGDCHCYHTCPGISVSIRNNDVRSTCPVSLSSVALMALLVARRRLSLAQPPITDHLHWPLIWGDSDSWPHIIRPGDPGS